MRPVCRPWPVRPAAQWESRLPAANSSSARASARNRERPYLPESLGDSFVAPRVGMLAAQVHRQARADTGYAGFTQGSALVFPVMPGFRREGAFSPAMTTRVRNARRGTTYRLLNTCDQMAIIPTNSASDASAAASSITALNMVLSPERKENIVHVLFLSQGHTGRYVDNQFAELVRVAGALFYCCPCLALGEVDEFGRMFSHGSADIFFSGIFLSADLYASSVAFLFSCSSGVNGGPSPDKLIPGIGNWAEAAPVNRAI